MEYMLNSTLQRVGFSKIRARINTRNCNFFVGLAEGNLENKVKPQGTKFYNGLKFHRVIPDFMVQGGCPQGTGTGTLDINLMMNFTQV
jgi:cyclophilin family peptidyl-prolyl cis-trans isomerase